MGTNTDSSTSERLRDCQSVSETDQQILFEHDGVFACISDMNNGSNRVDEGTLIPGKLRVLKNQYGILIQWCVIENLEEAHEVTNDWVLTDSVSFSSHNGSGAVDFKTQPAASKLNFSIDLHDLSSLKCFHQNSETDAVIIFICKDGTSYLPLHFRSGGCNGFLGVLQLFITLKRSAKENNLILVSDPKAEQLERSVNMLHQEANADILTRFMKDPYATAWSGLGKVTNFVQDKVIPALLNFEDLSLDEQDSVSGTVLQSYKDLRLRQSKDEDQLMLHHESVGFELVSSKLDLPPLPDVPRLPALSVEQWQKFMDNNGVVRHVSELRQIIFRGGITKRLRPEVWKFLLGYFDYKSTHSERQETRKRKVDDYFRMKLQWKSISENQENRFSLFRDRKALVEKDVARTDRTHPFFQGDENAHVQMQFDILMTYCMFNFDLGYVQGMSDLLSPIMVVMENEVDSFWCFVGFMERVMRNFEMDQAQIKAQLMQLRDLLMVIDPSFLNYLESHDSDNMFFCFRWILVLFKREFSFDDIMILWEVLWTGLPCHSFHLLVCLAILQKQRGMITENKFGFTEILKHVNELSMRIPLAETLSHAEGIYHQLASTQDKLPPHVCEILGLCIERGAGCMSPGSRDCSPLGMNGVKAAYGSARSSPQRSERCLSGSSIGGSSIELLNDDGVAGSVNGE